MTKKHILITGATGGIGSALAKSYASEGVHLSLLGRKIDVLENISVICQQQGATTSMHCAEITNTDSLIRLLNKIDDENPVDLVIANAGVVNFLSHEKQSESWDEIAEVFAVNFSGVIATISPFLERMKKRKVGQLALISSISAYHGMEIMPSYCASKAGLKAYGEALRSLYSRSNVKVSVVLPGFVESNMSNQFLCIKPFQISADKAARIIKSGLERNKSRIAFPFLMTLGMKLLTLFPCDVSNFILCTLGYRVKKNGV